MGRKNLIKISAVLFLLGGLITTTEFTLPIHAEGVVSSRSTHTTKPTLSSTIPASILANLVAPSPLLATKTIFRSLILSSHPAVPNPHHYKNYLISEDGTLKINVSSYGDCTGVSKLTRASAALDTCLPYNYFLGHNPGVFTPLMHMKVGDAITYFDNNGVGVTYHILTIRTWESKLGSPDLINELATAQFQTCITPDGAIDRILDVTDI